MEYALAKALQDAGFPQEGAGKWVGDPASLIMRRADRIYAPTLEELIEACGDRELTLSKCEDESNHTYEWRAIATYQEPRGYGSTPSEAVARLWLALQQWRTR